MLENVTPSSAARDDLPTVSPGYFRYALALLTLIYTLNLFDRQLLNILAEPIKHELKLADWQLGAISGLAFALFYATMGLPIARLAERYNRPTIIAGSLTCWSGFTAICGLAQGFLSLFVARVGVGVGEAGCTPTAHSLISEYAPRSKLGSALARYHFGTSFGILLGLALGGWMSDVIGWRMAFIVAGLPGIAIAVIAFVTLREPRKHAAATSVHISLSDAIRYLRGRRAFWFMTLGAGVISFAIYGRLQFLASFFFRSHAADLAQIAASVGMKPAGFLGLALGLCTGFSGLIGTWLGGRLTDRYGSDDPRAFGTIPAIAALAGVPLFLGAMLISNILIALILIFLAATLSLFWMGPKNAAVLSVAPPQMRATTSALSILIESMIGLGLGPLCVGLMSDGFANLAGLGSAEGVRWALVVSTAACLLAAWFFWSARSTLAVDFYYQPEGNPAR